MSNKENALSWDDQQLKDGVTVSSGQAASVFPNPLKGIVIRPDKGEPQDTTSDELKITFKTLIASVATTLYDSSVGDVVQQALGNAIGGLVSGAGPGVSSADLVSKLATAAIAHFVKLGRNTPSVTSFEFNYSFDLADDNLNDPHEAPLAAVHCHMHFKGRYWFTDAKLCTFTLKAELRSDQWKQWATLSLGGAPPAVAMDTSANDAHASGTDTPSDYKHKAPADYATKQQQAKDSTTVDLPPNPTTTNQSKEFEVDVYLVAPTHEKNFPLEASLTITPTAETGGPPVVGPLVSALTPLTVTDNSTVVIVESIELTLRPLH